MNRKILYRWYDEAKNKAIDKSKDHSENVAWLWEEEFAELIIKDVLTYLSYTDAKFIKQWYEIEE